MEEKNNELNPALKVLVSEKQLEAVVAFFDGNIDDILYGGAARGGKSEVIGIILAICIVAYPGSTWLLSRTVLADLKATTLASFLKVLSRLGFNEKSYKDKTRDEKHFLFENGSKLFVVQTNYEPSDPEFDRIGSYEFTGGFLDEGQSMSNQVREVLFARLSNTTGVKRDEIPKEYVTFQPNQFNPEFTVEFQVVGDVVKPNETEEEKGIDLSKVIEKVSDGANECYITKKHILKIPYKPMEVERDRGKVYLKSAWHYKGVVFTGCNPGTNFTRTEFWVPYKDGNMPENRKFIPSKVGDNPWVDKGYIERLHRLPETSVRKQRLLYGNFDYSDDSAALFNKQDLDNVFIDRKSLNGGNKYITVDAARQGKDSTEIGLWEDLYCYKIIKIKDTDFIDNGYKIGDLVYQKSFIEDIIAKEGVDIDNVIVDEVGVGGGLVDMLGCKGFIGNSKALNPYSSKLLEYKKRNYTNLRTQSYFYLQSYISKVNITCSLEDKQEITDELLATKQKDVDNDVKISLISKTDIKEQIGRSPDKSDMLSMRMWWIIKQHHTVGEAKEDEESYDESIEKSEIHKQIDQYLKFEDEDQESEELIMSAF